MSDGSVVTRRGAERKMCEGWLEHKTHTQGSGHTWQKVWCVLRGDTIYVFKSQDTTEENQLGNLTIETGTDFKKRDRGDPRRGFKFDLKTSRRHNTFKTQKSAEREEWRAYIMGLSVGTVPGHIDLLQQDIDRIQRDIDSYLKGGPNRESAYSGPESGIFVDTGSRISGASSGSNSSESRGSRLDPGGPVMTHRFYPDRFDDRVPSWFFAKCSRHTAETILRNIHDYGNTLLRESSTHKDNGSYVISKGFYDRSKGRFEVEHYEVMRVAKGYRINVENDQPEMICLSSVMDYFVSTTGGSAQPLKTNDMRTLGMQEPDYETGRIRGTPEPDPQPWVWPPPDYDDVERRQRQRPTDTRTVTSGILKKRQSSPDKHDRRWSEHPATVAFYPQRESQRSNTNMDDLQHRVQQTATLQVLDDAINTGFQHDQIYVNLPADPPPPPVPHKPVTHSYINNHDGEDPSLRDLPQAPPPPLLRDRHSAVAPEPSPAPPVQTPTSPSNFQARQRPHQPLNNSPSAPSIKSSTFVPPPLKKVGSEGFVKSIPKSPASPASFPTWTEPKQVLKSPTTPKSTEDSKHDRTSSANDTSNTTVAGVDDTNPGGVNDLKSRFEKSASIQSPTSPTAKNSPGMGKATSTGSLLSTRPKSVSGVTGSRDSISTLAHSTSFTFTNTRNQSVTNTNFRSRTTSGGHGVRSSWSRDANNTSTNIGVRASFELANTADEDYVYDDTAVTEYEDPNFKTEKKVAFQEKARPVLDQRRQTEPAISISKTQFEDPQQRYTKQQQAVPPQAPLVRGDSLDGTGPHAIPKPPPVPPLPGAGGRPKLNKVSGSQQGNISKAIIDDQQDFYRRGMEMAARRGRRQTEPALSPFTAGQAVNIDFHDELKLKLQRRIAHLPDPSPEEDEDDVYDEIPCD